MSTIAPPRIGCKKIGHARTRVADFSLPWIVFTGGRSLPDVRPLLQGYLRINGIDQNMAETQLALAAIDAVQVPPGDTETAEAKSHAMFFAGFGTSSPPMAAGAMLLLYQFAMAMIVGFGPLFILCLIFEQTKELFRKWLMYGIGTLFSIAMLYVVTSIVLYLTVNLAGALWSATVINTITGQGGEGYSSQAIQQGGIGLLMTVLIISVPPMASMFFQGTLGNFMPYAALGAGAASQPGPQGQPPGSYGGGGGYAPPSNTTQTNSGAVSDRSSLNNLDANATTRIASSANPAPQSESIPTKTINR
jgi:type IV secretion system protein VirB6